MGAYKSHGKWYWRCQVRGEKFHGPAEGATSRRKAEAIAQRQRDAIKAEIEEAERTGQGPETFDQAAGAYMVAKGDFAATKADTTRYLDRLVKAIGKKRLVDITAADIWNLVNKRRAEGVSPATVNRTVTELLRRVVKFAAERGQRVPLLKWGTFLLPEPQERIRELASHEEAALWESIRPDFLPVFDFLLYTGVRRAEAVNLTWDDVDFEQRTIRILGKGEKTRLIRITPDVRAVLLPLIGQHPTAVFTYVAHRDLPKRGIVKGRRYPITADALKTRWRRDRDASGVENIRIHDVRHTFATRAVRGGASLKAVGKALGHSNVTTTARYAHADLDDVGAAMEAAAAQGERKPRLKVVK